MDNEPKATGAFQVPQYSLGSDGKPFQAVGSMPDLRVARPAAAFTCGAFLLLLLKDPPTIVHMKTGRRGMISYPFSLAVLDTEQKRVVRFIGLEESLIGSRMLGIFDCAGSRANLGEAELMTEVEFLELATQLFRKETGCSAPLAEVN